MAFVITYKMFTGTWRREVATAEAAVVQYHELREAGAGGIIIQDADGKPYSVSELAEPAAARPTNGRFGSKMR